MGTLASAAELTATVAEIVPASMKGTGRPMGTQATGAVVSTGPVQRPDLSTGTARLLEDSRNPAVRAASARAPSAAMTMADKKEAFRSAAAPASVAAEGFTAVKAEGHEGAGADIGNRRFVIFPGRS